MVENGLIILGFVDYYFHEIPDKEGKDPVRNVRLPIRLYKEEPHSVGVVPGFLHTYILCNTIYSFLFPLSLF